jgi:hypothetical protein
MISRCCLCACVSVYPPIVARQRFGKGPLIVARQRLGKSSLIVARQQLGKISLSLLGNGSVKTNVHVAIEELFDASFTMWPVSYQGK